MFATAVPATHGRVRFHPPDGAGPVSPIADWVEDVINDLEDIEEGLGGAKAIVANRQGPLPEPDLSSVATRLDLAMSRIETILDPNEFPSLDPPDAGEIDRTVDPSTLPDYAKVCADLASDALDEALSAVVNAKVIGSHLKTIEYLITRSTPHNYQTKAGVE